MRRKISLYIAERLVDLDEQSFILFNYAMEDLTNPAVLKNSYSNKITIKGTPNNNTLFGDIFRLDRAVTYDGSNIGIAFNPSRKTPFVIYNEMNEVLESGYCKLDSVTRKGGDIEYQISLFGGLGSFLYSLAYDDNGNKRSLADLDYLGTDNSDTELDFTINAENVKAAWAIDPSENAIDTKWKVINFAPCYNGIPEGKFDADKALVNPSQVGLNSSIASGSKTYTVKSGYALVNLAQKYDEWAVKDLRSYLQRPVLSMRAFLEAVRKPLNNGGYVVNMPFLEKAGFLHYDNLWMTLPMIPSIGSARQAVGDLTLSKVAATGNEIAKFDVSGSVPSGTRLTASINIFLHYYITQSISDAVLYTIVSKTSGALTQYRQSVMFAQAVAYAADGTVLGGSKVKSIYQWDYTNPQDMASICGYVPPVSMGDETYEPEALSVSTYDKVGFTYRLSRELGFTVEAYDVAYYKIFASSYNIECAIYKGTALVRRITEVSEGNGPIPKIYRDFDHSFIPTSSSTVSGSTPNNVAYTSAESLRSGALITKSMLLSTSSTPADYLLSFCKIFGLHILFDRATREITILDRNDLYQDETIDLTKRVDTTKGTGITPLIFTSRWYDLKLEGVGGAFFDEYKSVHDRDYGVQRINTGYSFNADTKNIFEGNVFKNAATILAKSKYFTMVKVGSQLRPSPFMDSGNTYTLWSSDGDALDTDIPLPPGSAVIEYYNDNNRPGYDIETARKMEFRTKDNKPVDGENVLLFWEGMNTYDYFNLSDDVPAMDVINDGVPCWILTPGASDGISIPTFQRYVYGTFWNVEHSLDFGVPSEMDIPSINYKESSTIYSRFWQKYFRDRFDTNTKVMTCRVNFGGLQVGQDLLRKFFWYDNTLWVLNKISNYSLTTYDPVECEFVQVQDKDNYLNGQY